MICQHCGQYSDWIGGQSDWSKVTSRASARPLVECERCGNRQHAR